MISMKTKYYKLNNNFFSNVSHRNNIRNVYKNRTMTGPGPGP